MVEGTNGMASTYNYHKDLAADQPTKYPYWRIGGRTLVDRFRSAVSPVDPFAKPMVPSHNRVSYTPKHKTAHYKPDPYPNPVTFVNLLPVHYDPLKSSSFSMPHERHQHHHGPSGLIKPVFTSFPLGCIRARDRFEQCVMLNDRSRCGDEGQNMMEVCPNHVLEEMHRQKLETEFAKQIQIREFEEALRVSSYNVGRTITDVDPSKNFLSGTRKHLRPDSLWADDRYANVTLAEIEAAKERLVQHVQKHPRNPAAADIKFPNPVSSQAK